jgi:hypothetical protein
MSTALIEYTGDKASPGYWMSFRRRVRPAGHALPLPPPRGIAAKHRQVTGGSMKRTYRFTASALVLTFLSVNACAQDVKVMISGGFKAALEKLAPDYERRPGIKLWSSPAPQWALRRRRSQTDWRAARKPTW